MISTTKFVMDGGLMFKRTVLSDIFFVGNKKKDMRYASQTDHSKCFCATSFKRCQVRRDWVPSVHRPFKVASLVFGFHGRFRYVPPTLFHVSLVSLNKGEL